MNHIPTKLTEKDFEQYISPFLTKAKRGFVCSIPLYLIFNGILHKLYTGCQWKELPTKNFKDEENDIELTYQAFYYHFRKWSTDDSFQYVFKASIVAIMFYLNVTEINLDGTHTIAKKGGEAVAYQGRKKAKTSNILPVTDKVGNILGYLPLTAGNHNDGYQLKKRLSNFFQELRYFRWLSLDGAFFNADSAFNSRAARKVLFNFGLIPNMPSNKRNRKKVKRGRKVLFNKKVYDNRYTNERTHAWVDKFRGALIRFDKKASHWMASNFIAFAMVNLRNVI